MRGQKRAFLIDFDNTLLNTDASQKYWMEELKKHYNIKKTDFLAAYRKSKSISGYLDADKLARLNKVPKEFFYETPFEKFTFPKIAENIKALQKIGKVIVLSTGEKSYQPVKIRTSGVEKMVGKESVMITQNKKLTLKGLINSLKRSGYKKIFLIDDISKIFTEAKKVNPEIICIWLRFGKYKNIQPVLGSTVTYEANSFADATSFIKRFVSAICVDNSHTKLPVLEGIEDKQIKNLITYTKTDVQIKKYTKDKDRFKNIKTFSTWKSRNKIIYTLVDKHSKLLGLIWFSLKKYNKIPFTFAIRIYKPVRGKGLAKKFMREVFTDFATKYSKEIWLKTDPKNDIAIKLYKSYGFKEVNKLSTGEAIMTLRIKNS